MIRKFTLPLLLMGLILVSAACAPGGRAVKETDLIGSWSTVKNYDATEITFSIESDGTHRFNSFLRGRPYESGIWEIKGEDLYILANENNTYEFKSVRIEKEKLSFTENGKRAVFSRMIEQDPALEELNALIPELNKFLDVSFPPPSKATFEWMEKDSGSSVRVDGYKTTATVKVNGDFTRVNQAGKLLSAKGFITDPYNATEIMDGFRKDNIVCLVLLGSDPENNDICNFTIRVGAIN